MIGKREAREKRERFNNTKVTVKLQSKTGKRTLEYVINIFIIVEFQSMCHLTCFHLTPQN